MADQPQPNEAAKPPPRRRQKHEDDASAHEYMIVDYPLAEDLAQKRRLRQQLIKTMRQQPGSDHRVWLSDVNEVFSELWEALPKDAVVRVSPADATEAFEFSVGMAPRDKF